MFYNCPRLTSLDLSNFIFNENPDVEYMLSCGNSVSIPVKVTEAGYNYLTTNNCHLSSGSYFVKPDGTKW
jgi:hypothetical protein